ncbi:uncharacterized protein LOC9634734 [Selaginella moellendorffii]|nr:uncharacterized protein LOC9634734 [Selaginella moellendorffii]XP_024527678.1 uncharacterized protein LOC9634734 [Selaginella moellendorffii]XP_024527679.1 uncharacterized protein LOC9634734 [Selaginella moellendorffii]|eukprot:XP_024527677.1 uncharacterized protein LOC9634734 [Selaginella moellendorffii]
MRKHQFASAPSSYCSNLVVMLFALIVAFTLGFLASPIVRTSPSSPPPLQSSSFPSSSPSSSSSSSAALTACSSSSPSIQEKKEANLGDNVANIQPQSDDGFVSHVRSLPDDLLRFHYDCQAAPSRGRDAASARAAVIDEVFDGTSPFTAFPPPHIARLLKPHKIKGWGSDHPVFARLVQEIRPKIVVELGSFLGASAIHLAKLIREQQQGGSDFVIFCLDDFRGWPGFRKVFTDIRQEHGNVMLFNQFLQNVAFSNASDNIVPVPFSTNTGLYKLCELGISADLIEVDAGHDFHSAWTDINLAWSLMRPDGKSIMFGHDYFNGADYHGVRRAVDLFGRLKGLRVEPDGQHWIYRKFDGKKPKGKKKRGKEELPL